MTQRTVVLLRHAKAERANGIPDIDRPLTARGHADAADAGAWLAHQGYLPELVLCSPARRTRQTWHGVALALSESASDAAASPGLAGGAPGVRYEPAMYDAGAGDVLDLVRSAGESVCVLLLIGHNPTISQLSMLLDPAGGGGDGLRTSGIGVHRFRGAWAVCEPGAAPLVAAYTARGGRLAY